MDVIYLLCCVVCDADGGGDGDGEEGGDSSRKKTFSIKRGQTNASRIDKNFFRILKRRNSDLL